MVCWIKFVEVVTGSQWAAQFKMSYYVQHGDMHSEIFKVLIGLLTGDPALPVLWKLFLSDLSMMPEMDDMFLTGVRISLMAQGDDLLIISVKVKEKYVGMQYVCRPSYSKGTNSVLLQA
jgi:hypothetical protein